MPYFSNQCISKLCLNTAKSLSAFRNILICTLMNKMLLLPNLVFRLNCPEFKSCNVYCAINVVGAFYIAQDVRKNGNYLVLD